MTPPRTTLRQAAVAAALAGAALGTWAASGETHYDGLCEASAAVALDAQHFVVADDEHNVLSVYRVGAPARQGTLDLRAYLDTATKDGRDKKSDLEGAARVGGRIYWIGSHSRDSKGKPEPSRWRFFATDIAADAGGQGSPLRLDVPATPPYRGLLQDLVADPRLGEVAHAAAAKVGPEEPGGLNIEGLAATPQGHLLIGFRNPRPRGLALLVELLNPDELVAGSAHARFADPVLLDLGGRGIRSIDRVDTSYLIVAGPSGNGAAGGPGSDFALYRWSGQAGDKPRRWVDAELGTLGPEALFQLPGTAQVQLLSDDGDACKRRGLDGAAMRFRALTLDLSSAVFQ